MEEDDFLEEGTDVQQGCFDDRSRGTLKWQGHHAAGIVVLARIEKEGQVAFGWGDVQNLDGWDSFAPAVEEEGMVDGVTLCVSVCPSVKERRSEKVKGG